MTSLADRKQTVQEAAVHLLLIGKSKAGKTHMVADFILDGGTCLYVDNDNGLNTLRRRLEKDPAAMARCHYISTQNIYNFLTYFFARKILIWNETRDELYSQTHSPDDTITEIKISEIPFGVLLAFDSWTSACQGLLLDAAQKNGVTLETFNTNGEAVYGDSGRRANNLLGLIQKSPHHIVMQAHEDHYERFEKPVGSVNAKRKDMILKENITIPMSTSRPHGFQMPKYFNESGWLGVSPIGKFELDYRQRKDRVGGGSLMAVGDPTGDFRLSKTLFPVIDVDSNWIRTLTVAEFREENPKPVANPSASTPKPVPSTPANTESQPSTGTAIPGAKRFVMPVKN